MGTEGLLHVGSFRERVLPSDAFHLVLCLSGMPLRLYRTPEDPIGDSVGIAVLGGIRTVAYVRQVHDPYRTVGAELEPGATLALFGVPGEALAERHTTLDLLWGADAIR